MERRVDAKFHLTVEKAIAGSVGGWGRWGGGDFLKLVSQNLLLVIKQGIDYFKRITSKFVAAEHRLSRNVNSV